MSNTVNYGRKSFMLQAQVKFNSLVNFLNRLKLAGGEIREEASAKFWEFEITFAIKTYFSLVCNEC